MRNALIRSCPQWTETSFTIQVERSRSAGFPSALLSSLAEKMLVTLRTTRNNRPNKHTRSPLADVPYIHGFSHRLKKTAGRVGIRVLCSIPNHLASLCRLVNRDETVSFCCDKKHRNHFIECVKNVVYDIPLSCGKSYVGQTGRCINYKMREHAKSLKATTGRNLALYIMRLLPIA